MMSAFKLSIISVVFVMFSKFTFAQNAVQLPYNEAAAQIDGKMNEAVWDHAMSFSNFKTMKPMFGLEPSEKTIVKMYYNGTYIFVGVICYDSQPSKIKASLSSRDNAMGDDWVAFCLDSFNDNLNAYYFACNPLGVQNDGTLNAEANPDSSPDFIWRCASNIYSEGYVVEFAIPFETLRFPDKDELTMGFKVARQITRKSEEVDFPGFNPEKGAALTQFQKIIIRDVKPKSVLEFIPAYTVSQPFKMNNGNLEKKNSNQDFSLTSKIGLTSDITFDATYNPDFSQIETDAGQIDVNLRYSLYYPEKRPFFLEGKELTGIAGEVDDYPLGEILNTRTIVKPKVGMKISGRAFSNDKFYFLYALDDYPGELAQENNIAGLSGKSAHVTALRYAKSYGTDSYTSVYMTGRNFFDEYNYVTGFDGRLRINGKSLFEYHAFSSILKNHQATGTNDGSIASLVYRYRTNEIEFYTGLFNVSKDFNTQVGYITRTGITAVPIFFLYRFVVNSKLIYKIEPYYYARHSVDQFARMYEGVNDFSVRFTMPLQSVLNLSLQKSNEIFANKSFNRDAVSFQYSMEPVKEFNFYCNVTAGKFIRYDYSNPEQAKGKQIDAGMQLQLTNHFKTGIDIAFSDLYSENTGAKIFDATIYRNNTVIQFNENLYLRSILEYNDYQKQLGVNLLAAFDYIPGTVIYIGYGSVYQKVRWENERYSPADNFLMTKKDFFLKASYLIKL